MKKILTLLAAAAAVFAFMPTSAEAGGSNYRSQIHSRCGSCGGNVYSYYRPVSYCNSRPVYGWVPSYHSNCGRSHSGHGHSGYGSSYGSRGGVSIGVRFGSPSYRSSGYSSGHRSSYGSGYRGSSRSYGGNRSSYGGNRSSYGGSRSCR